MMGELNGIVVDYDETNANKILRSCHYKNGFKDGLYLEYRDDKIWKVYNFKNGMFHGDYILNLNEKERYQIEFYQDKIDGEQYYYNKHGIKEQTIYCFKNNLISKKHLNEFVECCVCYETTSWITTCNHPICISCCEKFYSEYVQDMEHYHCIYCRTKFKKISLDNPTTNPIEKQIFSCS